MASKIICIVCPNGCEMEVTELSTTKVDISGYKCEKGKEYAHQEIINPARTVTTTIKVKNGFIKRLPIRSESPIPKDIILEIMEKIKAFEIEAPVQSGDIIIENILNTGINIIASKSVDMKC